MKRIVLLVTAASLLFALGCGKRENKVVARVNDRTITIGQFENAAANIEEKYLPTTTDLAGKKELLDVMVNKEVMAIKALGAGYDKEPGFVSFWDRFKGQFLVAAMENELVLKKVTVTDEEAQKYFDEMHKEYSISQIVLPDENTALDVRQQIAAGADFAEMAKKYSITADGEQGGFLGSAPIGAMHWWVEEALAKMKEGEVSQPLRTSSGYALLMVHRIRTITPEKDLAYARERVKGIKQKQLIEQLRAKIEKEVALAINPDAVDIAYDNLPPDVPMEDIFVTQKVTRDNAPKLEIPEQYREMIMAQYADSSYTLGDFMRIYDQLALPERPRRENGKMTIYETIHKRMWDQILPTYAEQKLKVQDVPEVAKQLREKKEQFLVYYLYNDQVAKEIAVPEPDIRAYYDQHRNEITTQEQRDFSIIIVSDKAKAEEAAAKAKKGEAFDRLAVQYSEDPSVKQNAGRVGLQPRGKYVDYDNVVFTLPLGGVSEPFEVPRGWAVVKVEKIVAPEPVSYADAAQAVRTKLSEERADKLLKQKLETWRKDVTIKINEGNLKKAKLERTRPAESAPAAAQPQGQ